MKIACFLINRIIEIHFRNVPDRESFVFLQLSMFLYA